MIFCKKEDCKYKSNKPSEKYTLGGGFAYKCKAKHTVIAPYADGNSDQYIVTEDACQCITYERKEI